MLKRLSLVIFVGFFLFLSFSFLSQKNVYAADITAPVTTYTVSPSSANGKNGWYTVPVTYTLNATDLESGVKEINYQIDSAPWQKVSFSDTLNLVPNPSFEDPDVNSPIYTKYWIKTSPGNSATYTRDTSTYAPGFETVSIRIDTNANNGWHTISHPDNFAVTTPYKNMNSSVWIKTGSADAVYYKIFAVTQDQSGNKIHTEILKSVVLTGTNDWTQLSNSFTVNVNSAIGVYMEVGNEGKGTCWVDAASINDSVTATSTNVSIGTDGIHTLKYYSVDRSGNIETTHTVNFKIDQTPPGSWEDAGAIRTGNDHTLYVYAIVNDETSGISSLSNKYQYHCKPGGSGFGYFSNYGSCKGTWYSNGWTALSNQPFTPGDNSVELRTPSTDFCDDDWKVCKTVNFYAEDMAGNSSVKGYCINGPWIQVVGQGIAAAVGGISMLAEPPAYNTDGIIEIGNNNLSFFSGLNNWIIKDGAFESGDNYTKFWNLAKTKTAMGSTLPVSSGVYYVNGNLTVSSTTIPSNYSTKTFNTVVFVSGTLTINTNITTSSGSTVLFIVKGDAKISKSVTTLKAGIFSDASIYTAYDIQSADKVSTLNLNGVYAANLVKLQRPYQGTGSQNTPSEIFTYEPKYVSNLADFLSENSVTWLPASGN